MQGETTKTRAVNSSSSLLETFAIKNNKEEIVMYVINDVTNGGYVVVSATKYYAPIIAYSEDQTFIVDDSLNIKVPIFEVPLEYSLFHGFIDSYSYYIHMNWGWNGICNDWYYGDDYEPKVNGISSGYNFNTNKKYLKWVHD